MTLKFTDYVKLENMKQLVIAHLEQMGLGKEIRVMNDEDLNKLISLMAQMGVVLSNMTEAQKSELLMGYVVGLWTRLIVDYGADIKEL